MAQENWAEVHAKALGVRLSGEAGLMHLTPRGEREPDDTFLIFMNASPEDVVFRLSKDVPGAVWQNLIDTSDEEGRDINKRYDSGTEVTVKARSLQLFVLGES